MLDNIPHVKAFWIATGVEVAQMALWFGVDDLDGTVQEEKIYHMAGARTPEAMTTSAIRAAHPRRRPRADRARHALQRRHRPGSPGRGCRAGRRAQCSQLQAAGIRRRERSERAHANGASRRSGSRERV